jgi:hypothetical protein
VFRLKRRRVGWVERGETHPPMTGYHDFSSVRPRHTKAHEVVAGTQPTGLCPPLCSAGLRIERRLRRDWSQRTKGSSFR